MPSLPFLPPRPTQIKLVTYSVTLLLTATIGACVAIYSGFRDELIKCFLAGCAALFFFLLAVEEFWMEEMFLRGWQVRDSPGAQLRARLGRRDSGWDEELVFFG
jgi:hypothetical protein